MRTRQLVFSLAMLCFSVAPAVADLYHHADGSEYSLDEFFDAITLDGQSNVDATLTGTDDALEDGQDSYWSITASGTSAATIILELAGNANYNSFGLYVDGEYIEIFEGTDAPGGIASGAKATLSVDAVSPGQYEYYLNINDYVGTFATDVFGYYLEVKDGTYFHSDTEMNEDGSDHMRAYRGENEPVTLNNGQTYRPWTANEYVLAWEDLPLGDPGVDWDYQDFVVMVESVVPVPVPAAVLLGALGLGAAGLRLRKRG